MMPVASSASLDAGGCNAHRRRGVRLALAADSQLAYRWCGHLRIGTRFRPGDLLLRSRGGSTFDVCGDFANLFKDGSIGAGDIKLSGAIGSLIGASSTMFLIGAAAVGALAFDVVNRRSRKTQNRQFALPFAPFLVAGFLLSAWIEYSAI